MRKKEGKEEGSSVDELRSVVVSQHRVLLDLIDSAEAAPTMKALSKVEEAVSAQLELEAELLHPVSVGNRAASPNATADADADGATDADPDPDGGTDANADADAAQALYARESHAVLRYALGRMCDQGGAVSEAERQARVKVVRDLFMQHAEREEWLTVDRLESSLNEQTLQDLTRRLKSHSSTPPASSARRKK